MAKRKAHNELQIRFFKRLWKVNDKNSINHSKIKRICVSVYSWPVYMFLILCSANKQLDMFQQTRAKVVITTCFMTCSEFHLQSYVLMQTITKWKVCKFKLIKKEILKYKVLQQRRSLSLQLCKNAGQENTIFMFGYY